LRLAACGLRLAPTSKKNEELLKKGEYTILPLLSFFRFSGSGDEIKAQALFFRFSGSGDEIKKKSETGFTTQVIVTFLE
jgi:hypothetical protein